MYSEATMDVINQKQDLSGSAYIDPFINHKYIMTRF